MSAIPPSWLGSIIQTQGAKAREATQKSNEKAAEGERTGEAFADRLQAIIENDDRDSSVYSDAEGSGSQGRPSEGPPTDQPAEENDASEDAGGLDLQA